MGVWAKLSTNLWYQGYSGRFSMALNYRLRPAWRTQWLLFIIVFLWGAITLMFTFGAVAADVGDASSMMMFIWGVMVLLVGALLFRRYVWSFILLGDRIESHYGIVARTVKTLRHKDIRNINMRQSVIERLLDVGKVEFSSAGGSGIEVSFHGVISPMALQNAVRKKMDEAQP